MKRTINLLKKRTNTIKKILDVQVKKRFLKFGKQFKNTPEMHLELSQTSKTEIFVKRVND